MSPPVVGLIPIDRACAALISRSPAGFDALHKVDSGGVREHLASVIGMTPVAMLDTEKWGTFFTYEKEARRTVGACGFKSPPMPSGSVEISYFTFPPCEGARLRNGHGQRSGCTRNHLR